MVGQICLYYRDNNYNDNYHTFLPGVVLQGPPVIQHSHPPPTGCVIALTSLVVHLKKEEPSKVYYSYTIQ